MAERKDLTTDDQPFLSRWSERKRNSEPDPERGPPDTDPEQVEGGDAGTANKEQAANQAAAEAIDIDSLNEDSDYSPFFKEGVPPALKSAALQRLWRSNPVFANVDGLNDYDEDFSIPKTPMGVIRTAWKFGRGFVTDDDADNGKIAPDPPTADSDKGEDEAGAVTAASELDPVGPAPAGNDMERDPAPDPQPPDSQLEDDATGEQSNTHQTPGVGLRNRLDMAAFPGRDDD